ncbi:hypothetical protein HanIR_Chr14g0691481 [Helianthus annuus]|nr:hypothetical protein HanIR_Chr14g0691481 [Helianthus annuus]
MVDGDLRKSAGTTTSSANALTESPFPGPKVDIPELPWISIINLIYY